MTRHLRKKIAVFDESGSFRPSDANTVGFGVAALVFPESRLSELNSLGARLEERTGKRDYKYKHVQRHTGPRSLLLDNLRLMSDVAIYGFYAHGMAITREAERTAAAAEFFGYSREDDIEDNEPSVPLAAMRRFLHYMVPQLSLHAIDTPYALEVYWDERNDMEQIGAMIANKIASLPVEHRRHAAAPLHIKFCGEAKGALNSVSRISGIFAADIRTFFENHGDRIWSRLSADGLRGTVDLNSDIFRTESDLPAVAIVNELLADANPTFGSRETVMLQGYFRSLMRPAHRSRHGALLSFADPDGRMGLLQIENSNRFRILQLPD